METDDGYRRGTVLGLTIAEVFVLLVFLMMLALVGLNRYWSDKLDPWKDIIQKSSPAEVEVALAQPDALRRQLEDLNKKIAELNKHKERLQKRIRTLEGLHEEGETNLKRSEERLRKAQLDRERYKSELEEAQRQIAALTGENPELRDNYDKLQRENNSLRDKIRMIGKGITPPCWYQRIEETNPITKASWRERPYYLFDIVIRENHMEVQPISIPVGSAEDDGGELYSEEAEVLGLKSIPYGKPLTDRLVLDAMTPIYELGKASKIRSYSCIFYVRVWDETSEAAKERWKRAHDGILEHLFGTYQVRDISWSDRHDLPVNVPLPRESP